MCLKIALQIERKLPTFLCIAGLAICALGHVGKWYILVCMCLFHFADKYLCAIEYFQFYNTLTFLTNDTQRPASLVSTQYDTYSPIEQKYVTSLLMSALCQLVCVCACADTIFISGWFWSPHVFSAYYKPFSKSCRFLTLINAFLCL